MGVTTLGAPQLRCGGPARTHTPRQFAAPQPHIKPLIPRGPPKSRWVPPSSQAGQVVHRSSLATSHRWDVVPTWTVATTACPGAPGGFGGCRCVYGRGRFWGVLQIRDAGAGTKAPHHSTGAPAAPVASPTCIPGLILASRGARGGFWGTGGESVPHRLLLALGAGARMLIRSLWQRGIKDKGLWDTGRGVAPSPPQLFVPTGAAFGAPTSAPLTLRLLWGPGEDPPQVRGSLGCHVPAVTPWCPHVPPSC